MWNVCVLCGYDAPHRASFVNICSEIMNDDPDSGTQMKDIVSRIEEHIIDISSLHSSTDSGSST